MILALAGVNQALAQAAGSGQLALLAAGRAPLPVFVSPAPAADEIEAAAEWSRVLGKMAGAPVPVKIEAAGAPFPPGVYVGNTTLGRALLAQHPPTDDDGFAIFADAANQTLVLAGANPRATDFAVDWLLERAGGVNWYYPGPLGEIIPPRTDWAVPAGLTISVPAYLSREFTGLDNRAGRRWARRNLLEGRFEFTHHLYAVLPPELFDDEPEFFPVYHGERFQPPWRDAQTWQPDLANPAVASFAAARARRFFDVHPAAPSYSLGLNDNVAFDDGPGTLALTTPRRWFRGRPDYSDLVFTFMNRAADDLAPSYPGKYLGCLAYYWCENPPSFPVRPQVLPYLTNDRSFYTDPAWAAEDLDLIRRWAAAGPRVIGIYDYYYGGVFSVPRIFISAEVLSLRGDYAAGARAFFGELYPQWDYDALKAWLAARLLWDPSADTIALTAQFFRDLYGPAAGDVAEFFQTAEQAWRDQPGPPRWIKGYKDPYQALIFSDQEVAVMSAALERAAQRPLSPAARARLNRLAAAWAESRRAIAAAKTEAALAADPATDQASITVGLPRSPSARADGPVAGFFLRAGEWANTPARAAWIEGEIAPIARRGDNPAALTARELFAPTGSNLLRNPDLAGELEHGPRDWNLAWRAAEFLDFGSAPVAPPAQSEGFAVAGSDLLILWQDVPVVPGRLYRTTFDWRGKVSFGSRIHEAIAYENKSDRVLAQPWQSAAPPTEPGPGLREGAVSRAPPGAAKLRLLFYVAGQAPDDWVQFSDARVAVINSPISSTAKKFHRADSASSRPAGLP